MKNINRKDQSGYTIIELMVVVLIIGILGALSIPAYLSYTTKSQVTDGIALIGNLKTAIAEHYNGSEVFPTNRTDLGLGAATDTAGEYVSQVDVENGNIVITYGNAASASLLNETLALRAYLDNDGNLSWFCGASDAPAGLTAAGVLVTPTTVSQDILPSNCRGNFGVAP